MKHSGSGRGGSINNRKVLSQLSNREYLPDCWVNKGECFTNAFALK